MAENGGGAIITSPYSCANLGGGGSYAKAYSHANLGGYANLFIFLTWTGQKYLLTIQTAFPDPGPSPNNLLTRVNWSIIRRAPL